MIYIDCWSAWVFFLKNKPPSAIPPLIQIKPTFIQFKQTHSFNTTANQQQWTKQATVVGEAAWEGEQRTYLEEDEPNKKKLQRERKQPPTWSRRGTREKKTKSLLLCVCVGESWGTEKSEEEKEGFGIYKKIESGRYDQINMLQSFECIFFIIDIKRFTIIHISCWINWGKHVR